MYLRLREVVDQQVGLAEVLVRATMTWVQLQGPLIVLEGAVHLAGVAICVAEVVLDIGVARIAQRRGGEGADGGGPVSGVDGRTAGREVGIDGGARILGHGVGESRHRPPRHQTEQQGGDDRTTFTRVDHWLATRLRASCSSDRSLSALRVRRASLSK